MNNVTIPDFYPSFWEDEKLYTWGQTKDIMLLPGNRSIKQFYDIERSVHYDYQYEAKPMDIIFLSYDEPCADANWAVLKDKFPRAKRSHGVKGRTAAYHTAAQMSDTPYFFAVFPTIDLDESFDFNLLNEYLDCCDLFLFDSKSELPGGTGKTFDWEILKQYNLKKEFFISGGIGLDSVNSLKNLFKMNLPLYGIDVNSKFEDSNNRKIIKDLKKFKEIIENEI